MSVSNVTAERLAEIRHEAWAEGQRAGTVATLTEIREQVAREMDARDLDSTLTADALRSILARLNDRLREVQP